jgi:hypothetical protein
MIKSTGDTGIPYSLSSVISYKHFSSFHKAFCLSIASQSEPKYFHYAVKSPQWRETMKAKITALQANNTWILTLLSPGKKAIGCELMYRVNNKVEGSVERYKAQLIAKGYT